MISIFDIFEKKTVASCSNDNEVVNVIKELALANDDIYLSMQITDFKDAKNYLDNNLTNLVIVTI